VTGRVVPVYLLDSDLPENLDQDRSLTHWLYAATRATGFARKSSLAWAA